MFYFTHQFLPAAFLLALIVTLPSCTKHDPAPPRTELLTTPNWRLTGSVSRYTTNGTTTTTDDMPQMPACEKDDLIKYTATPAKTWVINQGPLVCVSTTAPGYRGAWDFNADESVLRLNPGTSYGSDYVIEKLTENTLVVRYERQTTTSTTTTMYSATSTYSAN